MNLAESTGLTMKELLSKEEFFLPKPGTILSGEVVNISKAIVFIDLGSIGMGVVYPGEFYDNPDRMKILKSGDKVSTMLLELENEEGYRELSLKAAQMTTAWQDIKEKKDKGEVITTKIININKGGLIVEVSGVQGFLPLSQLSAEHYPKVEGGDTAKIVQALQKFKGQDFLVKILDFNEAENKLIVSEKAIQDETAKEELAKLKIGEIVEGTITEVTDFGAFVKLSEMLDGLIHSSEIDWKFIEDPREILKPGDKVKAKIVSLDGGRISLSLKALKDDPWTKIENSYQPGQIVKGKATKIRTNGIFVELSGDLIAFLPIAELGEQNLNDVFEIGKEYDFAIVSLDAKEHKMVLTLPGQKDIKKPDDAVKKEEEKPLS
ncbi:MAG: 30S ribosomal protein S1 [Candidatus Yanofskybacteria bacterium CG10_big_fil_rev_8_21_14_0_10_37_15]|uniref:30S ribosomal protein S1 n=1 Tax=Candidatus Yanofskybacteria bacterium CG10_big_fil_rev_8_21_14_0_10_37_15 TaxID=1975097 RepID=A0A2H0R6E3_9BACT|nr:MAG: 30S ribosomal protein S1 [Candidatus Yanofskybacteria bacterium CG10_big_fil_rev_8_21_14_0_10_37_15]